jgi:hypothetical protein
MVAWLPFIVLVLLGPLFFALGTLLRVLTGRRSSDRRKLSRQAVIFVGMVAIAGLYIPLLPHVGVVWTFDIVMICIIVWAHVVEILIFGQPQSRRP